MRITKAQKKAEKLARATRNAKDLEVAANGKCPRCGTALRQNLSLFFWYQCEASGDRRAPEFAGLPKCGYQTVVLDGQSYREANDVLMGVQS